MRRGMWLVVMAGLVVATLVGWTARGSAAQVTPVASPMVAGDCDAAIADAYSVLDTVRANPTTWAVITALLNQDTSWLFSTREELSATSNEFQNVASTLATLPSYSVEGRGFAAGFATFYRALASLFDELSNEDDINTRIAIANRFFDESDSTDDAGVSSRSIGMLCGGTTISLFTDGPLELDGTPIANPLDGTAQEQTSSPEQVASPSITGDCDSAIADLYLVLDTLKGNSTTWAIAIALANFDTSWMFSSREELLITAGEFHAVVSTLSTLPFKSVEGRDYAAAVAHQYDALASIFDQLSQVEDPEDRTDIADQYFAQAPKLNLATTAASRTIARVCGGTTITLTEDASAELDGEPIANPAATPVS